MEGSMVERVDDPGVDTFLDVSDSYGHLSCFRSLLPLVVRCNPHTYIPALDPSDPLGSTWLGLALTGLENLKARPEIRIREAAIIGTGGGLDAIGIAGIFLPERLVASDLHPRALEAARWNVARYVRPPTDCQVLQSDLFRGYPNDSRFDLVVENLPNVPDGGDLFGGVRAASCYFPETYLRDPLSDRYLLTLHYNCLFEARNHLRRGGWIVALIGGRVPWQVIGDVFRRAGFSPTVLHFGLKTQSEAEVVLPGYAHAEDEGSPPFAFYYPVAVCAELFLRRPLQEPVSWEERAEAIHRDLEPYRVSAREALALHQQGERVCHSVFVVGAAPASVLGLPE